MGYDPMEFDPPVEWQVTTTGNYKRTVATLLQAALGSNKRYGWWHRFLLRLGYRPMAYTHTFTNAKCQARGHVWYLYDNKFQWRRCARCDLTEAWHYSMPLYPPWEGRP